jgi:hypothetical protein
MSENTHGTADETQERQAWFNDALRPYVHSGGLPTVPSSSLTLGTFATTAYVLGASDGLVYVRQAAAAVGPLNAGNGEYFVAIHRNTSSSVSSWTRQAGSHYVWRQTASLPADPSGGLVLAQITVAAGAITAVVDRRRPASFARTGLYDVTDPLYGAVGDASTDDTTAIQAAVDGLAATGGVVWFPLGTYKLTKEIRIYYDNILCRGAGWGSTLKMFSGGSLNNVLGVLTYGLNASTVETAITGGGVQDLHLDANDLCKPLYLRAWSLGTVERVMGENSRRSLLFAMLCHAVTISNNYFTDSNAPDQYGDGIYMEGCTDMKVLHNHVYDFTRIGIVSEQSGSTKSTNPLILGNLVQYGHDCTVSEHNSGIWCENTNGGRIIGNYVYDMYNSPAQQPHGITVWAGQNAECVFHVTDNVIRQVYTGSTTPYGLGISVKTNPTYSTVLIRGNRIQDGYTYGVVLDGGKNVTVEGNYFGDNTFLVASGCIFITTGTAALGRVHIGPNALGTMTYTSVDAAALKFYSVSNGITSLTIQGLKGWKINFEDRPTLVYIHDCDLTQDGNTATNFGIGATTRLEMSNCRVTDSYAGANATLGGIRSASAAVHLFNNVAFVGVWCQAATTATIMRADYNNCLFSGSARMTTDGNTNLYLRGCYISGYPTAGFLRGSANAGTLNIFVWDCIIVQGADNTPFVKTTADADIFCCYKTLKDSAITSLTTFTAAITGFAEQNTP